MVGGHLDEPVGDAEQLRGGRERSPVEGPRDGAPRVVAGCDARARCRLPINGEGASGAVE